jgi:hypothetical protein
MWQTITWVLIVVVDHKHCHRAIWLGFRPDLQRVIRAARRPYRRVVATRREADPALCADGSVHRINRKTIGVRAGTRSEVNLRARPVEHCEAARTRASAEQKLAVFVEEEQRPSCGTAGALPSGQHTHIGNRGVIDHIKSQAT